MMGGEALDHGGAGLVEADDLHLGVVPSQLQHDGVERADGRHIPEMGLADIDPDTRRHVLVIDRLRQAVG